MASVLGGFMAIEEWVPVDADESVVITRGNEFLITGHGDRVDVGSITASWEDTLHIPSELASLIDPDRLNGV
jgi:hypothetical protein